MASKHLKIKKKHWTMNRMEFCYLFFMNFSHIYESSMIPIGAIEINTYQKRMPKILICFIDLKLDKHFDSQFAQNINQDTSAMVSIK